MGINVVSEQTNASIFRVVQYDYEPRTILNIEAATSSDRLALLLSVTCQETRNLIIS
jgi:hypothetical protein